MVSKFLALVDRVNANRGVAVAVITVAAAAAHVSLSDSQANTLYVLFAALYVVYDLGKQFVTHVAQVKAAPISAPVKPAA